MKNKAQSTLEYVFLIATITAALLAMQVYIKRGLQGQLRGYSEQYNSGAMYSPRASEGITVTTTNTYETLKSEGNWSNSTLSLNQETERGENVASFTDEPMRW